MTDDRSYCLLDDPLISVRRQSGESDAVSLAKALSELTTGDIVAFEALQKHQRQPWHSFLTQLGAIAMDRVGAEALPADPNIWKDWLLDLTDGNPAPWSLVVDDVSEPAFMQPPIPEGSLDDAKYKPDIPTPDELDMLLTPRNLDVKKERIIYPDIEHWMYALVTLQTMEGYSGAKNYGIARMNSAYGNRPMVGMTPVLNWAGRFQRDTRMLVSAKDVIADQYGYTNDGSALLWLLPWDGSKENRVPLYECDPLFIEICRRIRFRARDDGSLQCLRATTAKERILTPDDSSGMTGDPWTPIDLKENKSLTVGENGFTYDLLRKIALSGDYERPVAITPQGLSDDGGFLVAASLVRGKGKTHGFHHRIIPVPGRVAKVLRDPDQKQTIEERAERRVHNASTTTTSILVPALYKLLTAGQDLNKLTQKKRKKLRQQMSPWTDAFDSAVDDAFFPELWGSIDQSPAEADREWKQHLFNWAEEQIQDAIQSAPFPSIRRYRAISSAESIFYGSARKHLEEIFEESEPLAKEEENEPITI